MVASSSIAVTLEQVFLSGQISCQIRISVKAHALPLQLTILDISGRADIPRNYNQGETIQTALNLSKAYSRSCYNAKFLLCLHNFSFKTFFNMKGRDSN